MRNAYFDSDEYFDIYVKMEITAEKHVLPCRVKREVDPVIEHEIRKRQLKKPSHCDKRAEFRRR